MKITQGLFGAAQAMGLLAAGVGVGLAINTASAAPDDAATLRALESRLAALEQVIVVSADGVVIGNRNANVTIRPSALEIKGKTVQVAGADRTTIISGSQARVEMVKAGDVSVNGRVISIRGTTNVDIKGSKIRDN